MAQRKEKWGEVVQAFRRLKLRYQDNTNRIISQLVENSIIVRDHNSEPVVLLLRADRGSRDRDPAEQIYYYLPLVSGPLRRSTRHNTPPSENRIINLGEVGPNPQPLSINETFERLAEDIRVIGPQLFIVNKRINASLGYLNLSRFGEADAFVNYWNTYIDQYLSSSDDDDEHSGSAGAEDAEESSEASSKYSNGEEESDISSGISVHHEELDVGEEEDLEMGQQEDNEEDAIMNEEIQRSKRRHSTDSESEGPSSKIQALEETPIETSRGSKRTASTDSDTELPKTKWQAIEDTDESDGDQFVDGAEVIDLVSSSSESEEEKEDPPPVIPDIDPAESTALQHALEETELQTEIAAVVAEATNEATGNTISDEELDDLRTRYEMPEATRETFGEYMNNARLQNLSFPDYMRQVLNKRLKNGHQSNEDSVPEGAPVPYSEPQVNSGEESFGQNQREVGTNDRVIAGALEGDGHVQSPSDNTTAALFATANETTDRGRLGVQNVVPDTEEDHVRFTVPPHRDVPSGAQSNADANQTTNPAVPSLFHSTSSGDDTSWRPNERVNIGVSANEDDAVRRGPSQLPSLSAKTPGTRPATSEETPPQTSQLSVRGSPTETTDELEVPRVRRQLFRSGEEMSDSMQEVIDRLNVLIAQGNTVVVDPQLLQLQRALRQELREMDILRGEQLGDITDFLNALEAEVQGQRQRLNRIAERAQQQREMIIDNQEETIAQFSQTIVNEIGQIRTEMRQQMQTAQETRAAHTTSIRGEVPQETISANAVHEETRRQFANTTRYLQGMRAEYDQIHLTNEMMRASATPTQLFRNQDSDIHRRARVRADVSQEEEHQAQFLYWALRQASNQPRTRRTIAEMLAAGAPSMSWTPLRVMWMFLGQLNEAALRMAQTPLRILRGDESAHVDAAINEAPVQPRTEFPGQQDQMPSSGSPGTGEYSPTEFQRMVDEQGNIISPSNVFNVSDPQYIERGGQLIPATRSRQVKNPKFDPRLKPGDSGYEPPYLDIERHVVGLGSKDNGRAAEQEQADRLLMSIPPKLYGPIHAQAVDRYFGRINYYRMGLTIEKYMGTYTELDIDPADTRSLFLWNMITMLAYGPMLYAFVTDARLQRNIPVFTIDEQEGVAQEFMELYELVKELASYERHAISRAERTQGLAPSSSTGSSGTELASQLRKFERDRALEMAAQGFGPGAVVIQTDDQGNAPDASNTPSAPDTPDPPPLPGPGPAMVQVKDSVSATARPAAKSLSAREIQYGIANAKPAPLKTSLPRPPQSRHDLGNGRRYTGKELTGNKSVSADERKRLFNAFRSR